VKFGSKREAILVPSAIILECDGSVTQGYDLGMRSQKSVS
jgi:hypothetical protein